MTKRVSLFDEMKLALLSPSEMEEAIFYTALKDQRLTKDSIMQANAYHGEIKNYLNALSAMKHTGLKKAA